MAQCKAKTKSGVQCKNSALKSKRHCSVHIDELDYSEAAAIGIGAALGNALIPGVGGLLGGAVFGKLTNNYLEENIVYKKKVFVSFDFDNDKKLKEFIIGQARMSDSPFDVIDHSLKEAAPENNWEAKARTAIRRTDLVIVMVGPHTHRAHGVLKEVRMAREENKRIVQIIGYRNGNYTAVPNAGRLYSWNWDNLKNLLS